MSERFVAMVLNYWGKGGSPEEAKKAARKAGARQSLRSKDWLVKLLPEGAHDVYVDGLGYIHWQGNPEGEVVNIEVPPPRSKLRRK